MNVLVCQACGDLNEVADRVNPGACHTCTAALHTEGPAGRGRCSCPHCGHQNKYPCANAGPLRHRLFAIEYYNPLRKARHKGRFFKKPDAKDLARVAESERCWQETKARFVPDQHIPSGDETDRLHRWGYGRYRQMFNARQLLGLELTCRLISKIDDERVRHALATNLSDLLRYQNLLCRYDTWALKSLDIFSVHGFPVGLVQCESNLLGIVNSNGTNVGSGGWTNITDKYEKAKRYCDAPFEVQRQGSRNVQIPVKGEWIGEKLDGNRSRSIAIHCADASTVELAPNSLDAVFTDPPYFGNVQYGELMDFCYVWLRPPRGRQVGRILATVDAHRRRTDRQYNEIARSYALHGRPLPRLPAHGESAQAGRAARLHLSSQQARNLPCRRRRHSRCWVNLLGLLAVSR